MRLAHVVLMLLVVQSTSIVLLMRYSKTEHKGPPYLSTAAILMAELLKLPFCIFMAARTLGGAGPLLALLRDEILGDGFADTLKCAVPAVAFTLQGNLLFVALANLEAPTYQVSYQCKTLFTALFSVLFLGRQLKWSQWFSLVLLVAGTVLVSDPWATTSGHTTQTHHGDAQKRRVDSSMEGEESFVVGIIAVLAAALLSSSSSVYFEKVLKTTPSSPAAAATSLWLRNIQLGIFATPLAACAMLLKDGSTVMKHGPLRGFDGVVWGVVLLNGFGGLLVAATMKYADNIAKCFATAIAIVSGTILSVPLFDFSLSFSFVCGASCTVIASTLYSLQPDWPLQNGSIPITDTKCKSLAPLLPVPASSDWHSPKGSAD